MPGRMGVHIADSCGRSSVVLAGAGRGISPYIGVQLAFEDSYLFAEMMAISALEGIGLFSLRSKCAAARYSIEWQAGPFSIIAKHLR